MRTIKFCIISNSHLYIFHTIFIHAYDIVMYHTMRWLICFLTRMTNHHTVRIRNHVKQYNWTSNGNFMHDLMSKSCTSLPYVQPDSAYLGLSRIWGIFWFINSRNENTLTKLNLTKLDCPNLIEIQNKSKNRVKSEV